MYCYVLLCLNYIYEDAKSKITTVEQELKTVAVTILGSLAIQKFICRDEKREVNLETAVILIGILFSSSKLYSTLIHESV